MRVSSASSAVPRFFEFFLQFTSGDNGGFVPRRLSRVQSPFAIFTITGDADVAMWRVLPGGTVAGLKYSLVPLFFLLLFFSPPEATGLH